MNFYGYYNDNELLGCMRLHNYHMNLLNHRIPVRGIGLVGVDLLHKKEKIAKEMVTYFLNHSREDGAYFALLYAFRPDFYKKMGFGFGPKMDHYRIHPDSFPAKGNKEYLVYLTGDDKEAVHDCYQDFVNQHHGMIEKTTFELNRLFMRHDLRIIGYRKNGVLEGYMVFNFKQAHENNLMKNNLIIEEWVWLKQEAFDGFLTFLHSQTDQINRVVIHTMDESFYYLLNDPRNETNNIIPHVYHEMHTSGVGLMYKTLDIKKYFKGLENHNFNGVNLNLKINVTDSFESKKEQFLLAATDGKVTINAEEIYDVELTLDISDFSSLIMGAVSFMSLYRLGLASISDSSYVDRINTLFHTGQKPMCLSGF